MLNLKDMEFLLACKMRCEKLYIGILNPLGGYQTADKIDLASPFSYRERLEMLHEALREFGVKEEEYEIVPFYRDDRLEAFMPKDAIYFLPKGAGGKKEADKLSALGQRVEILDSGSLEERNFVATEVRNLIVRRQSYEDAIPKSTARYIGQNGLDDMIVATYEETFKKMKEMKRKERKSILED